MYNIRSDELMKLYSCNIVFNCLNSNRPVSYTQIFSGTKECEPLQIFILHREAKTFNWKKKNPLSREGHQIFNIDK